MLANSERQSSTDARLLPREEFPRALRHDRLRIARSLGLLTTTGILTPVVAVGVTYWHRSIPATTAGRPVVFGVGTLLWATATLLTIRWLRQRAVRCAHCRQFIEFGRPAYRAVALGRCLRCAAPLYSIDATPRRDMLHQAPEPRLRRIEVVADDARASRSASVPPPPGRAPGPFW